MKQWVLPPGTSAEFVAAIEHVLSVYAEPYDAARPVVCFDERPCVLHSEVRQPLPVRPGSEAKRDHEYVREGSCCVLMAFEPLRPTGDGPTGEGTGWRRAWVRPQRRRVDFAACVGELCDEVYPEAEQVRLVCDNLNTHSAASLRRSSLPRRSGWPSGWRSGWPSGWRSSTRQCMALVHASAWLLAQCGRDRVLGARSAMPAASDRNASGDDRRGTGMDRVAQRGGHDSRVAVHNGRRADQAESALPDRMRRSQY